MTADQVVSQITSWMKRGIALALLILIAITCLQLLGVSISGVRGLALSQDTGIGVAGLAYLYSRL